MRRRQSLGIRGLELRFDVNLAAVSMIPALAPMISDAVILPFTVMVLILSFTASMIRTN